MKENPPAHTIIDCAFALDEVLKFRGRGAPEEILCRQKLLAVVYYSFDGRLHQGQIVVDRELAEDVREAFASIRKMRFPVMSVIPYIDRTQQNGQDSLLNNSSAFNYRTIKGTTILSNHAYGRAIDINPQLNPYIHGDSTIPAGATYNPAVAGTLTATGEIVAIFKEKGWEWGGDWIDRKDYMHFEKPRV